MSRENNKQCFEILILLLYGVKTMQLLYKEIILTGIWVGLKNPSAKKYLLDVNGKKGCVSCNRLRYKKEK
ncbi:MAG: hypothetical protein ACTHJ2_01085 [Candidatus Nitrosocosmicus sp.]